jgi:LAO/AO transport system kinase
MISAQSVLEGDRLALSRLLTAIERGSAEGQEALNALFKHTGQAQLIGVTGAPGTGKSSLVNQLALHYRHPASGEPLRVAIVAVDPSSPFTGGAVMGDRIRMRDLAGDEGVFIRSMASRGSLGGLAPTTASMVQAMDAAGYDIIFIETVGAGQAEVEIAKLADTTLVVEAPGLGDDVQAIKAGILEIADILVLNKADRPGVDSAERALKGMLQLGHPVEHVFMHHGKKAQVATHDTVGDLWLPLIQRTVSTEGQGIAELAEAIARHRAYLRESGEWERRDRARLETELIALLGAQLMARWQAATPDEVYNEVLTQLLDRQISPSQAVNALTRQGEYSA